MYTFNDIKNRLKVRPFRPFRLVTASGEAYDVTHPDLVLVGITDVTIGIGSNENPEIYERQSRVAIMHVTAMEDLPIKAPAPKGNGQK